MNCKFCLVDSRDPITDRCPQDVCPGSGGLPQCINAQTFLGQMTCPSKFDFQVWKYRTKADGAPKVAPQFEEKERAITLNNRLVGAIALSQTRHVLEDCPSKTNKYVKAFARGGVKRCLTAEKLGSSYGYDPAFMTFSKIYNGKIRPQTFYNDSEIRESYPYGFYSHQYNPDIFDENRDGVIANAEKTASDGKSVYKDSSIIMKGHDNDFKLFFDERLTFKQARAMLTYAVD